MAWMTEGITMNTNMKGGLMKGLGRMLTGESLFMATYSSSTVDSEIVIASSFPGSILVLDIDASHEYICQKSAFLCAEPNVQLGVQVTKGIASGLFGGEGFLLQRLSGHGKAFIEMDGSTVEYTLKPGETLKVDTGNVAAFEAGVRYEVETVKGFKNILFGGEGLFLTKLVGPGKVWLQTMTMPSFASRIVPYLPTKGN
jgi:uncharacterized protein (TIGR00266 family)